MVMRDRFFAKTRPDRSGCVVWTASKNQKGYGQFAIASNTPRLAHRVAWFLAKGSWPKACLLHSCDNPSCVNVDHLSEGSRADNNADMARKGRARKRGQRGERNHLAKLSWEAVAEIRASEESGPELAARFGVCRSTISQVRRRVIWVSP
jgi:hypothetical protein